MYAEISAAYASAKLALEIAKAANGLANYNELVSAVSEVNTKLMDATTVALSSLEKQTALSSEIADLKEKLRDVENWECQIERYKLHAFATGALAHALQQSMEQGEPNHYICTTCVGNRKKTILQPKGRSLSCPVCKISISTQDPPPVNGFRIGGSW